MTTLFEEVEQISQGSEGNMRKLQTIKALYGFSHSKGKQPLVWRNP